MLNNNNKEEENTSPHPPHFIDMSKSKQKAYETPHENKSIERHSSYQKRRNDNDKFESKRQKHIQPPLAKSLLHLLDALLRPKLGTGASGKMSWTMNKGVHAGSTWSKNWCCCSIFQSTTFVQDSVEEYLDKGFSYSRQKPDSQGPETRIAALEDGFGATCVSTGMARPQLYLAPWMQRPLCNYKSSYAALIAYARTVYPVGNGVRLRRLPWLGSG